MARHHYSALDRTLHRLALRHVGWQKVLSKLEDDIYSRQLHDIKIEAPVFITSLPRAGTTLLLNLASDLPGFATHTYRNMPFLLAPLLWSSVTRPFRKEAKLTERAHRDGVNVSFDSPEAFEEILWMAFWPEKYHDNYIEIWKEDDLSAEFEEFFRQHLVKIIFLYGQKQQSRARYVSKNNANIARIPVIASLFPDCRILVPFRNPVNHVASLFMQHQNLQKMHAVDPFTAEYMASIGHFDFGATLKPLDFADWVSSAQAEDPQKPEFWMRYWIAAFSYLASERRENVTFIDYENFCDNPKPSARQLLSAMDLVDEELVTTLSSRLHGPTRYAIDDLGVPGHLMQEAQDVYYSLRERALNQHH